MKPCFIKKNKTKTTKYYRIICKVCGRYSSTSDLETAQMAKNGVNPWICRKCKEKAIEEAIEIGLKEPQTLQSWIKRLIKKIFG